MKNTYLLPVPVLVTDNENRFPSKILHTARLRNAAQNAHIFGASCHTDAMPEKERDALMRETRLVATLALAQLRHELRRCGFGDDAQTIAEVNRELSRLPVFEPDRPSRPGFAAFAPRQNANRRSRRAEV